MTDDKRREQRHPKKEVIFIEVLSASSKETNDHVTLECTTKDISREGLKIRVNYPLIMNSILELLISLGKDGRKYQLTAQVKWVEKNTEAEYIVGFELIEADHSDFVIWRNMVAELES